ncbi:hypothetical protein CTAYLR_003716 [Chrysophaeum taylorii]|uniref:FH2 domain-containing protein n=1 Tax=Chrysophaeum taylorii TaxID=2483200 RepID=A0AAD7UN15_9STRA|nr:hypothetical protein CTAYLR_003716 [Chrysophaeum taylorii]
MGSEGFREKRQRSRSLAPLINAIFEEFSAGSLCWLRSNEGGLVSATVLSAPQPSTGRCVVRLINGECVQAHRSQLVAADAFATADEFERPAPGLPRSAALGDYYPEIVPGARCVLEVMDANERRQACAVVTRPNDDGRCVVRVEAGYAGGEARACRLVHAAQLTVVEVLSPPSFGIFAGTCGRRGLLSADSDSESDDKLKETGGAPETKEEIVEKAAPSSGELAEDPDYQQYYKMLKFGTPAAAVAHKMLKDGRDPSRIEATAAFSAPAKSSHAKKPPARRRATVKQLPLEFHDSVGRNSIWADVRSLNGIELHRHELEALFVRSTTTSNNGNKKFGGSKHASSSQPPRSQKIEPVALSRKRATNVAIALAGAKLNAVAPRAARAALRRLDVSFFDATQLEALAAATPATEEADLLRKHQRKNPDAVVAEAERFMLRVALRVDAYSRRVSALGFCAGFDERISGLEAAARHLRAACEQVQTSHRLKKLLTYVLKLSRELRDAKSREFQSPRAAENDHPPAREEEDQIAGFRLESLLRLRDIKAFDRQTSALEFVVDLMVKNDDAFALDFHRDIPDAGRALRVSIPACEDEISSLVAGVDRFGDLVTKQTRKRDDAEGSAASRSLPPRAEDDDPPPLSDDDVLNSSNNAAADDSELAAEAFHAAASARVASARENLASASESYASMLDYFGEDANMPPHDFFTTLVVFSTMFREARSTRESKNQPPRTKKEEARAKSRVASIDAKVQRRLGDAAAETTPRKKKEDSPPDRIVRSPSASAVEAMLQQRLGMERIERMERILPVEDSPPRQQTRRRCSDDDRGRGRRPSAPPNARKATLEAMLRARVVDSPPDDRLRQPEQQQQQQQQQQTTPGPPSPLGDAAPEPPVSCKSRSPTADSSDVDFLLDDDDVDTIRDISIY